MNPCKPLLVVAISFASLVSGLASAAVFTAAAQFQHYRQLSSEVAGSFSANLSSVEFMSLARFDPSLGTLNSVALNFRSDSVASISGYAQDDVGEADFILLPPFFINERNDTSLDVTIERMLRLQLYDPNGSSGVANVAPLSASCHTAYEDARFDSSLECSLARSQAVRVFDGGLVLGGLALGDFIGTNPLNLYAQMTARAYGACDGDDRGDSCFVTAVATWYGYVEVSYTYNEAIGGPFPPLPPAGAVPLPAPLSLLALGLGILGIQRRARR